MAKNLLFDDLEVEDMPQQNLLFDDLGTSPQASETPYSELSAWDLLKAGDFKGLAGRLPGNTQTDMADSFANVGSEDNTNGLLNNAGRDITEWGQELGQNISNVGSTLWDELTATSYDEFKAANEANENAIWGTYEGIARPAGMIAATPGVPAQARMVAGALYAPKFASDVANTFTQNLEGGTDEEGNPVEGQGVLGAAGSTLWDTVAEPFINLGSSLVNDPGGLADRIYEHPATLWDEVLVPATMLEGAGRGAKGVYDRAQEAKEFVNNLEDLNPYRGFDNSENVLLNEIERQEQAVDSANYQKLWEAANDESSYGESSVAPDSPDRFVNIAQMTADLIRQKIPDASPNLEQYLYGQMMHESGWGTDPNALEYNNFAGLHGGAKGRKYASDQEFAEDYAKFYAEGLHSEATKAGNAQDFARSLSESGYFEDPNWEAYGRTIEDAFEDYNQKSGGGSYGEVDLSDIPMQDIEDAGLAGTNQTLRRGIRYMYDWVKETFGKDIEVSGGRRSPEHNAEVNGSETSHHLYGDAVDINLEMLTEAEREAFFKKAKEVGFNADGEDMWHDRGSGLHAHLWMPDDGSFSGKPSRASNAGRPQSQAPQQQYAPKMEVPQESGELTDMFGRDFSQTEESISRMGQAQEALGKRIEQLESQKAELERANTYSDNPMKATDMYATMERLNREIEQAQAYRDQLTNAIEAANTRITQSSMTGEIPRSGAGRVGLDEGIAHLRDNQRRRQEAAERQAGIDRQRERQQDMATDFIERLMRDESDQQGKRKYENTPGEEETIGNVVQRGKDIRNAAVQRNIEDLQTVRNAIQEEINNALDSQIESMRANPGGKGVTTNYTWSQGVDELGRGQGQITGRTTVSNNPQWYQDFYRKHGRAPRKSEYPEIAREELMKEEEFATLDRDLRRLDELEKRYKEETDTNFNVNVDSLMEEVENKIFAAKKPGANVRASQTAGTQAQVTGSSQSTARLGSGKPTGKYEGQTVTNRQIFDRARELFGSIRIGRNPSGTSGIYDVRQDVARTDHYGNWETMWHEVGHRLDSALDLANSYDVQEAHAAMQRAYPNQKIPYSASEIPHEGVAEFVREYMTDPATARQNFPTLSKEFESRMAGDKELAARVSEMQDMMRRSAEQSDAAKVVGTIAQDKPKTIWEKVKETFSKLAEEQLDRFWEGKSIDEYIEEVTGKKPTMEESLYYNARLCEAKGIAHGKILLEEADGERAARMLKEETGIDMKPATFRMGLEKLSEFEKANKQWFEDNGVDAEGALKAYMVGRRMLDVYEYKYSQPLAKLETEAQAAEQAARQAEAAEAQAKDALKNNKGYQNRAQLMDALDKAHTKAVEARKTARKAAQAYESRKAAGFQMPAELSTYESVVRNAPKGLKDAAQVFWDLNDNLLKLLEDSQVISKEQYKALREKGEHYVSLAREFPDDAGVVEGMKGHGFINVPNPIKKLGDYGSTWDVQDPLRNMENNISRVCNIAERNKVGRILTDMAKKHDGLGAIIEKVDGKATARDSSFTVWENGEKAVYNTTPEIYRFMKAMTPDGAAGLTRYLLTLPARWLRAGATVGNVAFGAVNVIRDTTTAAMLSRYNFIPLYDTVQGFWHMARGEYLSRKLPQYFKPDKIWEEFKTGGVEFSTDINSANGYTADTLKKWRRSNANNAARWGLNWLARQEDFNNIMENATRVGLYNRARKSGATKMEAVMDARESTLDFGRSGSVGKKINKYIPFYNAAIQGSLIFVERCKQQPAKMAARLGVMAMASLALQAYIRDDKEYSKLYDELHDYEKLQFWMIPTTDEKGNKTFYSIPKPFTEGYIGADLPVAMVEHFGGKDDRAMSRWAKEFGKSLIPPTPFSYPILRVTFEELANKDMFRERDIVPQNEINKSPEFQRSINTSEFAKWAGAKTGLSPRRIDHVGQGLLAGMYSNATAITNPLMNDKREFDNPITRRFKRDPMRSPQTTQDYYNRKAQLDGMKKDLKEEGKPMSKEDLQDAKILQSADKAIRQFDKQMKAAREKEDRDTLDRVSRAKNNYIMKLMERMNKKY